MPAMVRSFTVERPPWDRAHKAMVKLKIPPAILDHIMQKQDVQILAKNLQDWLAHKKK